MKIYLVGGAVRDKLLGYPSKESDWVVVGASQEQLQQLGYQGVGRGFPVFLHPETREEYALARKERKTGQGYYGFECDFNPNVRIEEDLLRRDLTINAMAMDDKGQLIDPYGGERDLKAKILRHVSPAFVEDPLRVLRVARFAARYYHLGFSLANETRCLMYEMVQRGELSSLVPERVWKELYRSLEERNPEIFILTLRSCGALNQILPEIESLFGVPNPPKYHPEIDSGVHTIMVLKEATNLSPDPLVRFGALMHDIGKGKTPIVGWPSHISHEIFGVELINNLCSRLRIPSIFRRFAGLVSRFHLHIHRWKELKAKTKISVLDRVDAFRQPELFEKLLLVCEADFRGRKNFDNQGYSQAESWWNLFDKCAKISPQPIIEKGFKGEAIKKALHEERIQCAKDLEYDEK